MASLQSLISLFFPSSSFLGVDIGTTSIKISEVSGVGNQLMLQNYGLLESYGHLERLNDALQTSSLKLFEKSTIELLQTLLKKVNPTTNKVIASIPAFTSFTTLVEMPMMADNEMSQAVPFQARQYIPLPITEVAIDWVKVGEREDENGVKKQQVLLIAVPQEQIKKYQQIFKEVGLELVYLETESLALARVLIGGDKTPSIVVDIGSRSTNMLVVDGGNLKITAQNDFAGGTFTQAIASGMNIDVRRAEEIKKQRGLMGGGGYEELSTLMLPYLDAIIADVGRLMKKYETEYGRKVERIVVTGGSGGMLGIDGYIEKNINLPTIVGNPFAHIKYPQNLEPIINELGPLLSVSLGLAIRGVS